MPPAIDEVVRHLRRAVLRQDEDGLTDGQLLACFIEHRDEAAVAALLRRHGPMVWGVCRRILLDHHAAEDAFQATFLVLVRKAASVRQRERVSSFLYAVARQTALKARALLAKRRTRERQMTELPETPAPEQDTCRDLQALLDQALALLPEKYRAAIVVCDLEGKTRREAARMLGVPEGTLAGHLTRGRALLAKRLTRHGLAVTGTAVATSLSQMGASAAMPPTVLSLTIKAAVTKAAGQTVATELISGTVASLTEGVMKAMLLAKLKNGLGICLVLGLLMLGSIYGYRTPAAAPAAPAAQKDHLADTLILLDKQWWEAASNFDVDTLSKILADDWVCNPNDDHWTKAYSLNHYRRSHYTEVKILTERAVVRIDEHTAIMTYDVEWRGETRGSAPRSGHDRIIHCWVQRDGGWLVKYTECVHLPVTALAPAYSGVPQRLYPLIGVQPADASTFKAPRASASAPKGKLRVRASSAWMNEMPENAFDGRRDTDWNAGTYAPAWIEADLGAVTPLAGIVLIPTQDIIGPTTHEVWVSNQPIGNDRRKAQLVHTFKGETRNAQELTCFFPKDLSGRYVQVRTTQSPTWIAWWEIDVRVCKQGKVHSLIPDRTPKPRPRADTEALQGAWQLVSVEDGGKDVTKPWHRKGEWVVKDGWINIQNTEHKVSYSAVFSVKPGLTPKEIDINPYPEGVFVASDVVKGIYTLDGDTWKICLRSPLLGERPKNWTERPKAMQTKARSTEILLTFKRSKAPRPAEKKPPKNQLGPYRGLQPFPNTDLVPGTVPAPNFSIDVLQPPARPAAREHP